MNTFLSTITAASFVFLTSTQAFAIATTPVPVPEPSSFALMGVALTVAAFLKFKNRNK